MEKRIKYGGSFLFAFLVGMAIYVYIYNKYHFSPDSPASLREADISITARKLISSFDSSETLSGQEYLYKVLSVRGIVKKVKKSEQGQYTVYLGSKLNAAGSVSCSLDNLYKCHPISLKTGDSVAIRGTCAGHLSDVVMIQCYNRKIIYLGVFAYSPKKMSQTVYVAIIKMR